jgi:hypothetical protein
MGKAEGIRRNRVERIKQTIMPLFAQDTPESERDDIRDYLLEEDANVAEKYRALTEVMHEGFMEILVNGGRRGGGGK